MEVYWVGISSQRTKDGSQVSPLASHTPTGMVVDSIISNCPDGLAHIKMNFVDEVVVDPKGRLRNPTPSELANAWEPFSKLIRSQGSKIFIFFGEPIRALFDQQTPGENFNKYAVHSFLGAPVIFAHHPSYMKIYRHKEMGTYSATIVEVLSEAMQMLGQCEQ